MLRLIAIWLLAGALAWSQVPRNRGDQNHESGRTHEQTSQAQPSYPAIQIQKEPDIKHEGSGKQPHRYPWRELLAPANAPNTTLAIIGFFGIIAALCTLGAIRKQAKAQMDADRAWVIASIAGQPKVPMTKALREESIRPGIVWKIEIFGNTPARIIRETYRCHTVLMDRKANPPAPLLNATPVYPSSPDGNEQAQVVLPPGHRHTVPVLLETDEGGATTLEQLSAVEGGGTLLCAYGRIEYADAFGRFGITQFCAIFNPRNGGVFSSPDGTEMNPPGFYIGGPKGYNYNS